MKTFKDLTQNIISEANSLDDVKKKFKREWDAIKSGRDYLGSPKMRKFYNALFDYYASTGDMPYGTMKARDGDPLEWIEDRLMDEAADVNEAIWAKNVGQDAMRQIRAATPPYTVVAIKGKKVVAQSKPIMVSNQVPAFLHDFIKDNSDEALTIGVEDKYGEMVYTYHRALKGRGVRREETEIDEGTWELPDTPIQKKTLEKLMSKPLPVGSNLDKKYKNSAEAKLYSIIGDDELFDDLDDLRQKKGEKADARPVVKKAIKRLGIKEGIDEESKDVRGGKWVGDKYHMSKKDYTKLHKDFKSKINGKPYATTMDPKTGSTILVPVVLESVNEGIVILPKRSSRGGDVKEVGKDKRGGKTQYWWRHKNGLKNVYDSLEKLRYALRNDANFKDAEEITKQLGEAVNEAIWNKRMSDIEKSREFINPSGSKDLVKWLNTNTRLKVDKFQRDRKLKHDKEQDKIKGRSAVNSKVRNAARSIQIKRAQKKARKKDGFSEEIVDEGGMGRMKDPYTIRYVDPKQKDTTNISVVDGEQEAKKFLAKVKKKGMSGTIKKGSEQPGSIQTVKYNQSTDQLNKASRYDTLTGKRR